MKLKRKADGARSAIKGRAHEPTVCDRDRWALVILCLGTALVLLAVVWAVPSPLGDLYVALAGGQDVREGRLGQPDDWSFTTGGRIWINQNWGSHLLISRAHAAGGDWGLLVLKALLIAGMAASVAAAAHQRAAGWPIALLTAGAVALAARSYIQLRPNLATLMFAPLLLWLLQATHRGAHRVWIAVLVMGLWANLHGGFVFGLALMALWAVCRTVSAMVREGFIPAVRRLWPLSAAAAGAAILAAAASPFGIQNLTHALVVGRSPVWRAVTEWQPIFGAADARYGGLWEFFVFLGLLGGLWVIRLIAWGGRAPRGRARQPAPTAERAGTRVFEVVLVSAVVGMAFSARRFVPLAMFLLAPFLASQLSWLLRPRRRLLPTVFASAGLLLAGAVCARRLVRHYHPDNPMFRQEAFLAGGRETFAQRMIFHQASFPVGAAKFVSANGVGGRVFNHWDWEGFLRWRCPRLKLWIGGRAQQVYDEQTCVKYDTILQDRRSASGIVAAEGVHLAIVPVADPYLHPALDALVVAPGAKWAIIYLDGRSAVLADTAHAETQRLVQLAAQGRLLYPDEGIAAASRAACVTSRAVKAPPPAAAQKILMRAIALRPLPILYLLLSDTARSQDAVSARKWVEYFEAESRRLEDFGVNRAGGWDTLRCRLALAGLLAKHYQHVGRREPAAQWRSRGKRLGEQLKGLQERWLIP